MTLPVLITGATQRLGLAVASYLLDKGYPVVVTYRTRRESVDELQQRGATTIPADFSTQASIDRAIDDIRSVCGELRGIIHNASDWAPESTDEADSDRFNRMMLIHATAPYCINKALATNLTSHGGAADIIHMTDYVQDTGSEKHIAYAASKAALHNLTLSFARALSPTVKVNSIAPSLVMFNEHDSDDYRRRANDKFLLRPGPGAAEVVEAVDYIFNSRYVTGQTLHLNGGRHLKNA
ncbi:dihydromonapterin reductase [Alteromonas sp. CYL-A6]|uniref:dihydromonapterin reductase n=1 Tax=Alteromonas nitratireducens TaxID=3390813 RepID=UPI0034B414C7